MSTTVALKKKWGTPPNMFKSKITITITITNYLFRQNRTRNTTKVILITHTKISTLQRSCQGDCT